MRVEIDNPRPLDPMVEAAGDPIPYFRAWLKMRRKQVRGEFAGSRWLSPGGASIPWKKVGPFGNRPPPRSPLRRTGSLLQAYLGRGAGAIEQITKKGVRWGVRGSVHPGAAVHRGGGGKVLVAQANSPERIPVTGRMRIFLGLNFGVWLSPSKREIVVPRRPHATDNPEASTRGTALLSAHVRGLALGDI